MASVFLSMVEVIESDLIAGKITLRQAKKQMNNMTTLAIAVEVVRREKYLGHNKIDWQRDGQIDAGFYNREIRRRC